MKRFLVVLPAFCLLLVMAAPAQAGPFSLGAHGGYASYTLKDANELIDNSNEAAGFEVLDSVKSGWNYGLQVSYTLSEEIDLGLSFTRLAASSNYADPSGTVELDFPANLYAAFIHYLPANGKKTRVGAGASTGLVAGSTAMKLQETGQPAMNIDFDGTGFHFEGYFILDVALGARTSLFSHAGFRYANIGEVKNENGDVVYLVSGSSDKFTLDYNGFFLRVGLKLNL